MRILHIIDHVGLGGAQTILKYLFERQENNENIFYYALRDNGTKIEINHKNRYHCNTYSRFRLKPIFEIKKLINAHNIDVLHCHLPRSLVFGWAIKKIFVPNINLIYHEHGAIFRKRRYYISFLKVAKSDVDLFIAVSNATKNKLIEYASLDEEKIEVLYNFVDLGKFNPEVLKGYDRDGDREKLGIGKEDFVIGFAGRLSKVKGCEYLIRSIPYIDIPNFKVLIAGSGLERKKLEKLAENLKIKEKIIFLGFARDILNFYKKIDVLVVPSKSEASPLIFQESQALGISIIGSDVEALNEFIKDEENGLLFEFANEKDLAEKIRFIYSDRKLREKLVENGLKNVKKFSLDNYLKKLDSIYGRI